VLEGCGGCCRVLQGVAGCCNMLQGVAAVSEWKCSCVSVHVDIPLSSRISRLRSPNPNTPTECAPKSLFLIMNLFGFVFLQKISGIYPKCRCVFDIFWGSSPRVSISGFVKIFCIYPIQVCLEFFLEGQAHSFGLVGLWRFLWLFMRTFCIQYPAHTIRIVQ